MSPLFGGYFNICKYRFIFCTPFYQAIHGFKNRTNGRNLPLYPPTADTLVLQAAQKTASVFETSYHMPGIQIHLKVFFQSGKILALRTEIHFISTFAEPWPNQISIPYFPYRIVKIQWYSFYHPSHNQSPP